MIAAIEWIPAGRANPNPSKYEFSRAEQEFLERHIHHQHHREEEEADDLVSEEAIDDNEAWEDVDEEGREKGAERQQKVMAVEVPKVDPKSLPSDLRMDDYSSSDDGDDDEGGEREKNIAGLLLGGLVRTGF